MRKLSIFQLQYATIPFLFFLIFKKFWPHWGFVAVHRLSLVVVSGGYSSLQCMGFSSRWLLLLQSTGSRRVGFNSCGTWASVVVARGLSSCGARAQLLCGMWDLPRPGLEPVSPALASGFLATAPPGKPLLSLFYQSRLQLLITHPCSVQVNQILLEQWQNTGIGPL